MIKSEFDIVVRRKNCIKLYFVVNKICMSCKKLYVYYCVINEFRNYMLEVCVLVRFIFGNIV